MKFNSGGSKSGGRAGLRRCWWTLGLLGWLGASAALAQSPGLMSSPEDGGEFDGSLVLTFFQEMKDPIAIRFEGAGGVEFDCVWMTFGGMLPNMILECTPRSTLPAGATVTWTVNPDGTGFETTDGIVFPTTSGTFQVPSGGGDVTVTVYPDEGEVYNPEVGGPVMITFSEAMDQSVDPAEAISFSEGTWDCVWLDESTVTCTLQSAAVPGDYYFTLSGFISAAGTPVEDYYGSFVIQEGGGTLTVTPSPAVGGTYNPGNDGPVLFTFSQEMDLTVEPQSAISFSQGTWQCDWVSSTRVECSPVSTLTVGSYSYTLTGFRSATDELMPPFTGAFLVLESGGGDGTRAPACPSGSTAMAFPKAMSVCGTNFFVWEHAMVYPNRSGTGFTVDGWCDGTLGSLATLVRLDAQGKVDSTVLAQDNDTELWLGADPSRVLATRMPGTASPLVFGVYNIDNNFQATFEHALSMTDPYPEVFWLNDGRVMVTQDLGTQIEVILFSANGSVSWAKRYSSSSFGVDNSGGGFLNASQSVSVMELSSGFMMSVTQTKPLFVGDTLQSKSTNILARLSSDGAVQWAKKYTGLDTFPAPVLGGTEAGSLFLQAYTSDEPEQGDPTYGTLLIMLNANGEPAWGKSYAGAMLNVTGDLPNGKYLLSGGFMGGEDEMNSTLFVVMSSNGTLEQQVRLSTAETSYGFGFLSGNRVFCTLVTSPTGGGANPPRTALIGSADLQLQNWTWRQYAKSVGSAMMMPDPRNSTLLFSAFHEGTHAVDAIVLNSSLQPQTASCTLFADATVSAVSTNLVISATNVVVSAVTVQAANFTPSLSTGHIPLSTFTLADTSLCGAGGDPTPVTVSLRTGNPGQVVMEFDSVASFNYTLQRATRLSSPDWSQVEVVAGTGARISRTLNATGDEGYYRVVTSAP
ncbi:MAG: hypothetical protein KJ072_09185 [Verrucomicrobia bacterium]|nr:hypothetical protein [Verrucomicrobiota bacterium]